MGCIVFYRDLASEVIRFLSSYFIAQSQICNQNGFVRMLPTVSFAWSKLFAKEKNVTKEQFDFQNIFSKDEVVYVFIRRNKSHSRYISFIIYILLENVAYTVELQWLEH